MSKFVASKKSILDLGCANLQNPFYKNPKIVGFDLKKKCDLPKNYSKFISGDVMQLESYFENEKFDAVVAGELLEHLENPVEFLRQCYTVLNKDGILLLSTPNPNSIIERLLTIPLNKKYFYTKDHIMLYPQRWLIRIMEIAGFKDVKLYSGGMIFPIFSLLPFPRSWCYQTIVIGHKK